MNDVPSDGQVCDQTFMSWNALGGSVQKIELGIAPARQETDKGADDQNDHCAVPFREVERASCQTASQLFVKILAEPKLHPDESGWLILSRLVATRAGLRFTSGKRSWKGRNFRRLKFIWIDLACLKKRTLMRPTSLVAHAARWRRLAVQPPPLLPFAQRTGGR